MSAVWYIAERIAECATIVLYVFFLYRNLQPIGSRRRQVVLTLGLGVAMMTMYASGIGFRPLVTMILMMAYSTFVFGGLRRVHALWCLYAIVIDGIVDHTVVSGFTLLTGMNYAMTGEPGWTRVVVIILSKASLMGAYLAMTLRTQHIERLPWRTLTLLMSVPAGCWMILNVLFRYNDMPDLSFIDVWLPFIGGLALLLIAVANVMFFYRILAQQRELAASEIQLRVGRMTQRHVDQLNDLYEQLSRVRHDLRHHFEAIDAYCRAGDCASIGAYIHTFLEDGAPIAHRYVEHPVLDALIASKEALAREMGIEYTHDIVLPQVMPVTDVELCILLGNLLDNAFEANEKVSDISRRYVQLNARLERGSWSLLCRNAVETRRSLCTHECLASTKKEPGMHGIGTRQIRDIAEATGGGVVYTQDQHIFTALVMLVLPSDTWKEGTEYGGIGEMEHEYAAALPSD